MDICNISETQLMKQALIEECKSKSCFSTLTLQDIRFVAQPCVLLELLCKTP